MMAGKRRARSWHRTLGLLAALPLVWVVLTGWVLNRATDFGFDRIEINHPWVLAAYGMAPEGEPVVARGGGREVVEWDGQFFLGDETLDVSGKLIGVVADGAGVAVVTDEAVVRLNEAAELIETLDDISLPELPLLGVAEMDGVVWLQNAEGWQAVSEGWLEFRMDEAVSPEPAGVAALADQARESELQRVWSRGGLSAYRVVLDLHAAKFIGPAGKYFYDLVTFCTLWLTVSGLILFFRKPRRPREKP